jgi:hypothetical protein
MRKARRFGTRAHYLVLNNRKVGEERGEEIHEHGT